jgi:hypothetical protein
MIVLTKLALALLAGAAVQVWAAEPAAEEYRVKGAFLLNFTKFVEWPAEAFHGPGDAIAICVLGENPFTAALEQAAGQVVVEKRTVVVRQIADPRQARQCQIVFVSVAERKRARSVLEALQGASVLTVGESAGFIAWGGMIEFRVEDSKVRMAINAPAAKLAGLLVSAKLLSLSQPAKR